MPDIQLLVPGKNQRIDDSTRDNIKRFIKKHHVLERLPSCNAIEIEMFEPISEPCLLHKAHKTWTITGFLQANPISEFPHQPNNSICSKDLTRLSICCIEKRSGGMGSHFGFIGTYVSMLISLVDDVIWDVRSNEAT